MSFFLWKWVQNLRIVLKIMCRERQALRIIEEF